MNEDLPAINLLDELYYYRTRRAPVQSGYEDAE